LKIDNIKFVLVETSNAGNIGAAARAMRTMGISQLALVNPCEFRTYECFSRASGAYDVLDNAQLCDSLQTAVADCSMVIGTSARLRTLSWPQIAPQQITETIESLSSCENTSAAKVAVVFGRERSGLSNDELILCSHLVVIPSVSDFSSLNMAAAVQVIAYEVRRGYLAREDSIRSKPSNASTPQDVQATQDALELMYDHMESTMMEVGYLKPDSP